MKPTTRQLPAVPINNGRGLGPRLLNITEVAELMNVKPRFIRRLIEERRISYLKIGKFIRFDQLDSRLPGPGKLEPEHPRQRPNQLHKPPPT